MGSGTAADAGKTGACDRVARVMASHQRPAVEPPAITTVFFDVGGVILTNGWDRHSRATVAERFGLDSDDFRDRHDSVADAFETGRMSFDDYVEHTVFHERRSFTVAEFASAMRAESRPLPGMRDLLGDVAATPLLMATLNNESAELNRFRITEFGLTRYFSVFLSSSFLGVKKPDPAMYAMALDITMREPDECLFVDDRPLNVECAQAAGMHTILHTDAVALRAAFEQLGLLGAT